MASKNGKAGLQEFVKDRLDEAKSRFAAFEEEAEGTLKQLLAKGRAQRDLMQKDLEGLIDRVGSSARIVPVPAWLARTLLPPLAALRLVPLTPWHWRGAPAAFVADLEDAKRELGWRPAHSNVDALVDAYESFVASPPAESGAAHRRPLAGPLARVLRG